jgi:hypothetical protein
MMTGEKIVADWKKIITRKRRIVTLTYRGFTGPGWELSVTGEEKWAKRMAEKYIRKIQEATQ